MRASRAQAAMEFLMTYGWAVLIIMVVVAVLFYIGVFNPSSSVPKSCVFPSGSGFSCVEFNLDEGGRLVLDLGQASGRTVTVTGVGCSVNASPTMLSITPVDIRSGGHGWLAPASIPCEGALGLAFRGKVVINYTLAGSPLPRVVIAEISAPMAPGMLGSTSMVGITGCQTINSTGTYYVYSDLSSSGDCITFNSGASGSTLDCQDHSITGIGAPNANGVKIYGPNNVAIRNCIINGYNNSGVYTGLTTNCNIQGNTISNCKVGISLNTGSNCVISANTIEFNNDSGVYGMQAVGNITSNIIRSNKGPGAYAYQAANFNLVDNIITNNSVGISCAAGTINATRNTVNSNSGGGIGINMGWGYISNNTINGNTGSGMSVVGMGSTMSSTNNNIISNGNKGIQASGMATATSTGDTACGNTNDLYCDAMSSITASGTKCTSVSCTGASCASPC